MKIEIREAAENDMAGLISLLYQVHDIHAAQRPDIFMKGMKKFSEEELMEAISSKESMIFVAADENGEVLGHLFCEIQVTENKKTPSLCDRKALFVDDLCVDEKKRGMKIGEKLFEYAKNVAKSNGCDSITLNIWNFNEPALRFYERIGFSPLKTVMEQRL